MDFLRSFNVTYSRMVDGSGRLFWVRWYPAAPEAKVYPHFHAFGHPVWEDSRDNFEGVGCIYTGLRWRRNRYPAPPGQSYRGDPAWYLDGLPPELLDAPETGERCDVPAIIPTGGCVLGGSAYLTLIVSTACQCEVADTRVGPLVTTACECESADTVVGPGPWIVSTACQCEIAETIVGPGPWIVSVACQCEQAVTPTSAPPGPVLSVADQGETAVSTCSVHSVADQAETAVSTAGVHSVADQAETAVSTAGVHSVADQSETAVSTDTAVVIPVTYDCGGCPDGAPLVWRCDLAGCTGDFAQLNGTWIMPWNGSWWEYHDATYDARVIGCGGSGWELIVRRNDGPPIAQWETTTLKVCLGDNSLVDAGHFGTGTVPTVVHIYPSP